MKLQLRASATGTTTTSTGWVSEAVVMQLGPGVRVADHEPARLTDSGPGPLAQSPDVDRASARVRRIALRWLCGNLWLFCRRLRRRHGGLVVRLAGRSRFG